MQCSGQKQTLRSQNSVPRFPKRKRITPGVDSCYREDISTEGSSFVLQTFRRTLLQRVLSDGIATAWFKPYVESSQARCCSYVIFSQTRSPCTSFQCEARRDATKAVGVYYFVKFTLTRFLVNSPESRKNLSFICFQALLEFVVTPFHGPRKL